MGKPMSWKWKLTIAAVAFVLFFIGFVLSDAGNQWYKNRLIRAYNETPDKEKRTSLVADQWLWWADFRGSVCLDDASAMQMYKEFMGYDYGRDGNGLNYMNQVLATRKLKGMCSPDGKIGWGPMHPDAPDAFWNYLDLYRPTKSGQFIKMECGNYFRLFYLWHMYYSGTNKPHPKFMKHWPKILEIGKMNNMDWPQGVIPVPNPPQTTPWTEPTTPKK